MSTRTLIEINHDLLHQLCGPGALSDFIASLGGTNPRPPTGVRVLAQRHHTEPFYITRSDSKWFAHDVVIDDTRPPKASQT